MAVPGEERGRGRNRERDEERDGKRGRESWRGKGDADLHRFTDDDRYQSMRWRGCKYISLTGLTPIRTSICSRKRAFWSVLSRVWGLQTDLGTSRRISVVMDHVLSTLSWPLPNFVHPERLLIPISQSKSSKQRSTRISSPSSVSSLVHRMSFPSTPTSLLRDPAQSLTRVSSFHSIKDAQRYLGKYKHIENAINVYYNEGRGSSSSQTTPSWISERISTIFLANSPRRHQLPVQMTVYL